MATRANTTNSVTLNPSDPGSTSNCSPLATRTIAARVHAIPIPETHHAKLYFVSRRKTVNESACCLLQVRVTNTFRLSLLEMRLLCLTQEHIDGVTSRYISHGTVRILITNCRNLTSECIRHTGSQSHKGNSGYCVQESDGASKGAGHLTDNTSENAYP